MGKLRGFMEYDRINEPVVVPDERIQNYKEFTIAPKMRNYRNKAEDAWIAEFLFVTVVVHWVI